ncbi:hypothetical protein L207DRAFT_126494 [Hyaloscypha variabilis F]|uniref:C2H2-type domain-containing protein n=1 Tax=Hyaloscypha variabilis (strain UAMH 11265 / GT02V1 / F) TaxID=1149755 RepID=A0A2J6R8B3_HYAVF|nr:hypothetical protein L207DRAFT_126494 [Hyaloscypha variabilis F]
MVGIGAGLLEPWTPRSKSPNLLSDLTVADVSQKAFVNYNIVDDYFTYESTSSSALWSLPIAGIDSDYDYNFDMDSAPSTLSITEMDDFRPASGSDSLTMFSFENPLPGKFSSTRLNPVPDLRSNFSSSMGTSGGKTATTSVLSHSGPFICGIEGCHRSYKRIHEVRRHRKVHSSTKPYACTFSNCRRSGENGFIRKDHLKQHLRQVHRVA